MKKILFTMLGAALIAVPASAQMVTVERVDVNRLKSAIEKSDAEIADPKRAARGATWVSRGETFLDVESKPISGLYAGMPEAIITTTFGDAPAMEETINGVTRTVLPYEHFKVYMAGGAADFYIPTTIVDTRALDKAYEAFAKAYELDPKTARKVGEGMGNVRIRSFEHGSALYSLGDFKDAADNFRRAFRASTHATSPAIDTLSLYYAGMSAAYGEDYATSLADIDKVLEMGYEAEGETYYLKFIDLYNLDRRDESLETLKTGIALYPDNEKLIDMIMSYYAENEGDPSSLIPMVEDAIAKNPENARLYMGLARIYNKLGEVEESSETKLAQYDKSIETIKKAVAIAPDDFLMNYFEGLYIVQKGDAMNEVLGRQAFTNRAESQAALESVLNIFRQAVAPLERAYEINPEELATLELLKNLTFRLREDAGMQAKYDKYNELLSAAIAQ